MDDLDEFNSVAVGEDEDEDTAPGRPLVSREERHREKDKITLGRLCQYVSVGAGKYLASPGSIKSLPSDCYTIGMTNSGEPIFQEQRLVTDSLLRLPDSKSDEVIAEVNRFWTLKPRFKEMGFSHKRGFLLYGPPGSGKTSTIAIIISDMVKAGGTVFLADHPGILARALNVFRKVEADRPCVVILEDIDTLIHRYGESEILAVLDGESQVENICYIATTNYPERLDARLAARPSRFDRIVKIGMPNDDARRMYLEYKKVPLVHEGVDLVAETKDFSIAHLKELIISVFCQDNTVAATLTRLRKMKDIPASTDDRQKIGMGR